MKLIFCQECQDVVKLDYSLRACKCGKSYGRYLADGLQALICSDAIPLGFANPSLAHAIYMQPDAGAGYRFEAFVIPRECPSIKVEKATQIP